MRLLYNWLHNMTLKDGWKTENECNLSQLGERYRSLGNIVTELWQAHLEDLCNIRTIRIVFFSPLLKKDSTSLLSFMFDISIPHMKYPVFLVHESSWEHIDLKDLHFACQHLLASLSYLNVRIQIQTKEPKMLIIPQIGPSWREEDQSFHAQANPWHWIFHQCGGSLPPRS